MLNACSAYVATDGGQVEQNGKKPWTSRISQNELEVHLVMWTRWTVVSVILTADFNSDRYDSEHDDDDNDDDDNHE